MTLGLVFSAWQSAGSTKDTHERLYAIVCPAYAAQVSQFVGFQPVAVTYTSHTSHTCVHIGCTVMDFHDPLRRLPTPPEVASGCEAAGSLVASLAEAEFPQANISRPSLR